MVRNVPVVAILPEVGIHRKLQFFRVSPIVSEQVMMTIMTTVLVFILIPMILRTLLSVPGLLEEVVPDVPVGGVKSARKCHS